MTHPAAVLVCAALWVCGCSRRPEPAPRVAWRVMGTFASITVPHSDEQQLQDYSRVAQKISRELEESLSIYRPESELSEVNRQAGKKAVSVSMHMRRVLELSRDYAVMSDGAFDPTVAPLVRLWGFSGGSRPETLPGPDAIEKALELVGYAHVVVSNETLYLDKPGMSLDLGGIAKGYMIDVCYGQLRMQGATHVMINLGGNIRCMGEARPGRPWRIGVRNPFDREQILGAIELPSGMAVATSGNYERFVMIDGKRYAHVVDPRTGHPVRGLAGVTVVSPTATEADALSTACFVLGAEGARELASRAESHVLVVLETKPIRILASPWMQKQFKPLEGYKVEPL